MRDMYSHALKGLVLVALSGLHEHILALSLDARSSAAGQRLDVMPGLADVFPDIGAALQGQPHTIAQWRGSRVIHLVLGTPREFLIRLDPAFYHLSVLPCCLHCTILHSDACSSVGGFSRSTSAQDNVVIDPSAEWLAWESRSSPWDLRGLYPRS